MNATTAPPSAYLLHEKIILPAVSGASVLLLSWIMYVLSRRIGRPKEGETFKEKLYVVQSIVSAFLLGQIAGHTTVFTTAFPLMYGYLFVLGGILFLRHVESFGRGWRENMGVPGLTEGGDGSHDFDVDPDLMEEKAYVAMSNLSSKDSANVHWSAQDKRRSNFKRQWMLIMLMLSFTVIATMNGFIMVYRVLSSAKVAIIACFIVNGAAQTVAVLGAMIHAGYHVTEEKRTRILYWCATTGSWLCVLVCTTIPVLLNVPVSKAQYIINSPYFSGVYLFSTGLLWRLSYYYEKNLYECRNRKELFVDALVFTVALAISATTGFWL
jgi:hypothetical protein